MFLKEQLKHIIHENKNFNIFLFFSGIRFRKKEQHPEFN